MEAPRLKASSLIPGLASHPTDVYIPNWDEECPAALDVTVISPLQPQEPPGHALKVD